MSIFSETKTEIRVYLNQKKEFLWGPVIIGKALFSFLLLAERDGDSCHHASQA
jgi:hypothetical protein